jgi:coenzyme F420 hydrogenase subunit beta
MASTAGREPGNLFTTVVAGGYCVGCGACATTTAKIRVKMTPLGTYQAALENGEVLSPAEDRAASAVCGFSAHAQNEDDIAGPLYSRYATRHSEIGYHAQTFTGYVEEGSFRADGSSGGMGTWIASELLRLGHVDAVVHVRPCRNVQETDSPLFEFSIARSTDDLRAGSHSHYYPVTLVDILKQIKDDTSLRYALIGVPCFVKAARLLAQQDEAIAHCLRYYIGLVCGHLKSAAFAMSLGWQAQIAPESLEGIDFRDKIEGKSPRKYGFRATGRTAHGTVEAARPMAEIFGGDWGLGFFKYKACDYCDDVFAETADVVIGDAWLPQFDADWRGTNVLIVRHALFRDILAAGADQSRIKIAPITADMAAASQRSGLSHRREGLSWRLAAADRRGEWRPPKRVIAGSMLLTRRRRRIYELREQLRDASHAAFAQARARQDFRHFQASLQPLIKRYYDQFKPALWVRIRNRFKTLWTSRLPR